jgi:hypothetical protein
MPRNQRGISAGLKVRAVVMKIPVSWDITPCSPLKVKVEYKTIYPRRYDFSMKIFFITLFYDAISSPGRSQWPRGLRHELSSPAQTLGSWVRIPLEVWMSVCVYSVYVEALRRADPPSRESYRLCIDQETEKAAKVQQRAVEP